MREAQRSVGRYDLLEVIGRGGAATVYLAYQRDLRRHVALKELAAQHVADPSFAARFVEESRLAGAMSHPSIVTVHEYFEHDGIPYIAMEYLPRSSLRPYVGRLSVAQIVGVLESVLAGLSHGESQGVVHRDLKPENLLVAADGRVKIADFGVARAYNVAAPRAFVTVSGTTIGTPAYMAPEQALGEELTPATDLYSLGIVAWEMFTGDVPFEQTDTPVSVLYRQVHEPVPPVRSVDPEIDERLAQWLDRMLAKRPEDRFQTADSAWEALEDIVIDLLGPRWRREARLGGDPPEPDRHPLTPAQFEQRRTDDAAPAEAAAGQPSGEPAGAPPPPPSPPATVDDSSAAAPSRPPARTTVIRPARRHPSEQEAETAPAAQRPKRRRAVAVVLAATVLAAGAGVLVGISTGGGSSRPRTTPAEHTPSTATIDSRLAGVLAKLAAARAAGLGRLRHAHNAGGQAAAAASVADAYKTAAGQAVVVPGSPPALHASLDQLAGSYAALAAATRARSDARYRRAAAQIATEERGLRLQAARL